MERPEKGGLKQLNSQKECGKIMTNRRRYRCPVCGKQTLFFLRDDTEVKNLPVKCKTCGKEVIVNILPSLSH